MSGIYSELYLKPIWKDRNDGMTGVLFSSVKIDGLRISKKFNQENDFWNNLEKLVFWGGWFELKLLKLLFWHMKVQSLSNWQKPKVFKGLKVSGISGFSFWAIEPIWKDKNGRTFTKTHFRGNRRVECYFHGSKLIIWMKSLQKVSSRQIFI